MFGGEFSEGNFREGNFRRGIFARGILGGESSPGGKFVDSNLSPKSRPSEYFVRRSGHEEYVKSEEFASCLLRF